MTSAVTVVVPTRNRRRLLATTLDAILGQEGADVEVVVVDEASSDDTEEYLHSLGEERVRVIRHDPPKLLPGARNAGIAAARTEWVAFCDDDDLWAPTKLAAQQERLAAVSGSAWSCTGCVYVDDDLVVRGGHRAPSSGDVHREVLANNVIPGGGSTVVARTALVQRLGGFRSLPASEDWDMWIRLAGAAPLAAVDAPLVAYRVHQSSHSHDVGLMERADAQLADDHADARARLGVEPEWVEKQRYYGRLEVRNRDRVAAARRFATIARRSRARGDALGALLALASPRLLDRVWLRTMARHLDPEWIRTADQWLDPVRRGTGPTG